MKYLFIISLLSFTSIGFAEDYMHARCGDNGYMVCHVPPGNPDNRHLIKVGSINAIDSHVAHHGDQVGKCPETTYEELRDTCGICDSDIDDC